MKALPKGWSVHRGRDPEEELRNLKRRFKAVSGRFHRAIKLRRLSRGLKVPALAAAGALALAWGLMSLSPWPPVMTLKHLASFPACGAARAFGLAPAYRGTPGYWAHHDGDGDGTSCEPWIFR